jgi:hypothetical protein
VLKSAGEIELPPKLAPKRNIYFSFAFVFVGFDLYSIPIHIPYIDLFGGSPHVFFSFLLVKATCVSSIFAGEIPHVHLQP